ncbi:putative Mg2+ transporter-C (MgtC) family protein [Halopseudomonas litoralis]|uniref:Protein MgtC n=1 Tax=Halopseudomonas litoralis TaxID=797277 RepID=A0A1H1LW87_9GAMM|nr:MgtC/SapB family protein [Halopseudomonas litoralis]SDR78660.1 putative Mg2+ transporter-C (MgtC) family protein [Halopseudomonas litoralis]
MDVSEIILTTLVSEFSDLTDIEQATRVTLRLLLAALLGGLLGYERETHGKAAGIRTHMLVCTGAALFVLGAELVGAGDDAMSRVVQGIVAGIGFLGVGTIIKGDNMSSVKGLTTAAGVWMTSAVGVSVGLGLEATAVFATLLMLFILNVLPHFFEGADRKRDP